MSVGGVDGEERGGGATGRERTSSVPVEGLPATGMRERTRQGDQ